MPGELTTKSQHQGSCEARAQNSYLGAERNKMVLSPRNVLPKVILRHWQNEKVCERENKCMKVALHRGIIQPFVFSSVRNHLLSHLTSHESFHNFSVIFSGKK